ncbi:unnamed protein product [Brassica oleracea]
MAKEKSYVVVVLLLSLLLCLSSQAGVAEAKHHLVTTKSWSLERYTRLPEVRASHSNSSKGGGL